MDDACEGGGGCVDLSKAESVGSVCALLGKWGMSTSGADFRLVRLQSEWADDGSVTPPRSKLRPVNHTALVFLHMKDLMAEEKDDDRVIAFRKLVLGPGPRPVSDPPRWWPTLFKRHERLMSLIYYDSDVTWEGPVPPPDIMRGIQLWEDFVTVHPEWSGSGSESRSVVFFRDTCPGSIRQRALLQTQIHGTCCYMQAPSVLVHYLCCLYYKRQGHNAVPTGTPTMSDLTKFKLRYLNSRTLWDLIHEGIGKHSTTFLQQLCEGDKINTTELSLRRLTAANIVRNLTEYGPALVSSFVVKGWHPGDDPVWPGSGTDHHAGCQDFYPVKMPELKHAVLIVGHRTCDDGTVHFLIQNWWLEKQFFTCDVEFLQTRQAKLEWVTTPVKQVHTFHPDEVVSAKISLSASGGTETGGEFTV